MDGTAADSGSEGSREEVARRQPCGVHCVRAGLIDRPPCRHGIQSWLGKLANGELLHAAEDAEFSLLITTDQNLK